MFPLQLCTGRWILLSSTKERFELIICSIDFLNIKQLYFLRLQHKSIKRLINHPHVFVTLQYMGWCKHKISMSTSELYSSIFFCQYQLKYIQLFSMQKIKLKTMFNTFYTAANISLFTKSKIIKMMKITFENLYYSFFSP